MNNRWGTIGELVFILESDGDVIPGQIIDIKMIDNEEYYIYRSLNDEKLEHDKCETRLAGFKGGKIFKNYNNAKEYYRQMKTDGNFNMSYALMHNLKRNVSVSPYKQATSRRIYEQTTSIENYNYLQSIIIAAMLLAFDKAIGLRPSYAQTIIDKYSEIISTIRYKDIIDKAQKRFNIDLEVEEEENETDID